MPPVIAYLAQSRLAGAVNFCGLARVALQAAFHLAAFGLMLWSESGLVSAAAFVLTWGLLNFFWIMVLRRPAAAAALSLAMILVLIQLARLKQSVLFMTIDFVDLMIIDTDTFAFLLTVFPDLARTVAICAALAVPLLILLWWIDPFRLRVSVAAVGFAACIAGIVGLSVAAPKHPNNDFVGGEHVSKFARSGASAIAEYVGRGLFEADAEVPAQPQLAAAEGACHPAGKPPHIVMVFDESSFDISVIPGTKVPPGYHRHFASFDGKMRAFVVEGIGGPSWFTEYNVLTGLSVRSFGRFSDFVTRIAAGRVERGLPASLRRCGYKTFSLYPFHGAFLSARGFQLSVGIEHFIDMKGLGTKTIEADSFYFAAAAGVIDRERSSGPLFLLVYTAINHFPWTYRYRPELLPEWRDPGNGTEVDEYLRRQAMSARDYAEFEARLARDFPDESFLIVRFGDHLPGFAPYLFDPELDQAARAERIAARDPRFLTTYYAINTVNFRPPLKLPPGFDRLKAPYLPMLVLEAAGLPLDATFAEQKRIFERCHGLFYQCDGGAEARRFNRRLIDAGLIKGF
jgi:Sulfatase